MLAGNVDVSGGKERSLLLVKTADRLGLLREIIKVIADININVESAEIETEGFVAKDKFHVSYSGAALNSSPSQVLVNCLRCYLRRPETDDKNFRCLRPRKHSRHPNGGGDYLQTSVMAADFQAYLEISFENTENTVQSWHIDGHWPHCLLSE